MIGKLLSDYSLSDSQKHQSNAQSFMEILESNALMLLEAFNQAGETH